MRSSRYSTLAAAAAALATQVAFAQGAEAAVTAVIENSKLAGVDGLTVGGTTYDVSFVAQPASRIPPVFAFEFSTSAEAQTASDALESEVLALANIPTPSPFRVTGCDFESTGRQQCVIAIPSKPHAGGNNAFVDFLITLENGVVAPNQSQKIEPTTLSYDYAVWTPEAVPGAPEPATLTLLGLGLAGVAGRRARKRKKTTG